VRDTRIGTSAVSMPAHHNGNVVLITGGSDGIGLAIARSMAAAGHEVVVCGRDEQRLTTAQEAVSGLHAIRCDVTDQSDVTALLTDVERCFGRLDVLVNNAGMQLNYLWSDEPPIWTRVEHEVALNLTALINVTHAALPLLHRSSGAAIINVGSGTALLPKPNGLVYSATKAAVHSFTVGLRWELADAGIRVVELFPPVVDTAMTVGRIEDKATPASVAEALVRGLERNRSEIFVGKMKAWPFLVRFVPRAAATIARKR
jgi:uncharacterized oxidoreductase